MGKGKETLLKTQIIGISGKIGSGKDTVGGIIQLMQAVSHLNEEQVARVVSDSRIMASFEMRDKGWEVKKYADKLKQIAEILTGIPKVNFESQEFKKSFLGEEWGTIRQNPLNAIPPFADVKFNNLMSVREFLQKLGTEGLRNNLHENVWVNALFSEFDSASSKWLVTDVRFQNEADAIKNLGGIVVRIDRGMDTGTHASETSLDDYKFDYTINNKGSLYDLVKEVAKFCKVYRLK